MTWDTIVIGSGAGGLSAAVALARAGQRVLVLEQHALPGGWMHSFTIDGYTFSPGVHSLGDCHEGGATRRLFEGLGLGEDLELVELNPQGFDHFIIEDRRFDQPRGRQRWEERLVEAFPAERAGLTRYLDTLQAVNREVARADELARFPAILTAPWKAPALLRWGLVPLSRLLDACVDDPWLRAVLAAQCGNHGLAPSRVSIPVHAAMTAHYWEGAYYPRGGGRRIAHAFIRALRRHGGQVRVRCRVREIVVEGGRVAGVVTADGERIEAGAVVCNADPATVLGTVLAPRHCRAAIRKVDAMDYSVSMVSAFLAVDLDLAARGYDSGNYWYYRTRDVEGVYRQMETSFPGPRMDALFLAISTLKDPGPLPRGHHTIEMFTFLPSVAFDRWAGQAPGERGPVYESLKADLARRMLHAAEAIIPGLRRHVRFMQVGTPVTAEYYCQSHRGAVYGTAKTPFQVGPFGLSRTGEVEGLVFCGASILGHGVAAAAMSGVMAAAELLELESPEACLAEGGPRLRILPPRVERRPAASASAGSVDVGDRAGHPQETGQGRLG